MGSKDSSCCCADLSVHEKAKESFAYKRQSLTIEGYFVEHIVKSVKKNRGPKSTYAKETADPKFRKLLEKEYGELVLSELILAMMAEDQISVRKLAEEVGIAPSVLQSVRSGTHSNMTLRNFIKLISALGGEVTVKRGTSYIPVKIAA